MDFAARMPSGDRAIAPCGFLNEPGIPLASSQGGTTPSIMEDTMATTPTFQDPQEAFRQAIVKGRLSERSGEPNYAGHYMYMGHWSGVASFKHIVTRKYDV